MTVNTNTTNSYKDVINADGEHTYECCSFCAARLYRIEQSQLATQKLVTEFVESMSKNPMLGAMAKMMGGKRT